MKIRIILLLFSLIVFTDVAAGVNAEEARVINQRLENILRESRDLPAQKKARIVREIKSIQRILANDRYEPDPIRHNNETREERPDNWNKPTDYYNPQNSGKPNIRHYDSQSFKDLKVRIKAAWPYRDQLAMIKRINSNSSFTTSQILEITRLIDFPNNQKEVALLLLPNSVDLENVDILYELFWTASDKEKLNKIADEYLH